jgi:hypothetical protein
LTVDSQQQPVANAATVNRQLWTVNVSEQQGGGMKRVFACAVALSIVVVASLAAQVKTQQKNQVKFEGPLGTVVGLFGGKAAREGVIDTVIVSGDRKMTANDSSGQIVDLAEEKVYDLDMRNKTYKVTTFDELRRRMQEAQAKAEKNAQKSEERRGNEPQKEYQVDIDVKDTGQRKTINGFDCREVITTITVHEKGKTLEESGGLVTTADSWLTQRIPAMKEIVDFDRRYAEKLMGANAAVSAEQMAAAMAMYPGLKDSMAKLQASNVNMDGTPIMTTVTVAGAKSPDQAANEQKAEQPAPSGVGGMLGGLGKRLARKKEDQGGGDKSRNTIMTMNHEVMSVSTSVDPAAIALPAGFRQK